MKKLSEYNKKRNFNKTKEPKGKILNKSKKNNKFVIQHHMARKDHYDFRLEYNGVFVSFAVPKGLSFSPNDKRLAIKVENHPLSYGNFEGVIPKGNYGAGTVMLFDYGTWEAFNKIDFNKGPIKFNLKGKRCKGAFTLIKMKDNNWLLIKEYDSYINKININKFKTSIKTGRNMKEIAENAPVIKDIDITSPEKIIYKKSKIKKKDIIEYYKSVSKRIMSFLSNRLISTIKCPNGNLNEIFFMKHLNKNSNKDLGKVLVKDIDYYYIKNINGLLKEVQMNSYEFHIWSCKKERIKHPDILIFDVDPDVNVSLNETRKCCKETKKILDKLKLKSYIKTSGKKGYHIYVPLNNSSFKKQEEIAKKIADILTNKNPDKYTTNMRKSNRKNKIFIDYYRNKFTATSVCPYSLRLNEKASISCPITWKELDTIKPDSITIKNIKERLNKKDPWSNFFE